MGSGTLELKIFFWMKVSSPDKTEHSLRLRRSQGDKEIFTILLVGQ